MELKEKAAYLKGLVEGLGIDESTKEGKVIRAMCELLDELTAEVSDIRSDVNMAFDEICDINDELEDLGADLFDEDDEDDESNEDADEADDEDDDADLEDRPCYEVPCPACGETVYVTEDDLDAGEAYCPNCRVAFEVALADEDDEEEGPAQYEVTCSACGTTSVMSEDELLSGEPVCPNCGRTLDFQTEE